ncbi:MAG: aldo/keto reductase [Clostridia bacterium]|nr:aldo/keto reductase [Clostridia bacterium]
MQYRKDRYGNDVSILGYGCMRLTQVAGRIDLRKAEQELMTAYRLGVNYFDTAYVYPGSEAALGEVLHRNGIREKVRVATKLPHYLIKSIEGLERTFQEQLRRLQTDYVDYYLMHMLTDTATWKRLSDLGILDWLAEKRRTGAIRQIGFSYHGNSDMFCALVDAYDWDFCQIQYNYLDEHTQAGATGLHYAASTGLPVVIMEPLRGGRLADKLPKAAMERIERFPVRRGAAEWAFRWLWNQPEVTCVLSGMNSVSMVEENARAADESTAGMLSEEELGLYRGLVEDIAHNVRVPCTGCRYCMPCPRGVDIPGTFAAYNRLASDGRFNALRDYLMCTVVRNQDTGPSRCVQCGLCEQHCPQRIAIRLELQNARKALEGPAYKVAKALLPRIMKY